MHAVTGWLALVGGGEFGEGCSFDRELLEACGGDEVVVLPTGAAFENPVRVVEAAVDWFGKLGATVRALPVLQRSAALDPANARAVAEARFVYLAGTSPLHLRSVLKETAVWDALRAAWHGGAVVAGAGESASALCDPMVDPRGGAFTVGLGLVSGLSVLPHAEDDVADHHRRTLELARGGLVLAAVPDRTALLRLPDGSWRTGGDGIVRIYVDGQVRELDALDVVTAWPADG
jgi:cyanophycinase